MAPASSNTPLPGLWQLGSGNFTDYDLHVRQAYFAPDAQYMSGEATLLQLHGVDNDGKEMREMFSVGKDWISTDGGKTIEYAKGGNAKIRNNSMYGHFIASLVELGEDVLKQFMARGDASNAQIYIGAIFHMDEKTFTYGGNVSDQTHNMPTAFLGFDDDSPVANQTNQTATPTPRAGRLAPSSVADRVAAAKAAAGPNPVAASPASTNGNSATYETLNKLAMELDTFNAFVDAASDIPEVQEDDELLNLVLDPTENGYYATQRAIQTR